MAVLCTLAPEGGLLGIVAPLALGVAAGTALVVDLDPNGPQYASPSSLADVVAGAARLDALPPSGGVAVLRNGGIDAAGAGDVVSELARTWPALVVRVPIGVQVEESDGVVPVLPLLPGGLARQVDGPAVYQRCGWAVRRPGPGLVLPRPGRQAVRALLEGRRPASGRWIRAWRKVWEHSWT